MKGYNRIFYSTLLTHETVVVPSLFLVIINEIRLLKHNLGPQG